VIRRQRVSDAQTVFRVEPARRLISHNTSYDPGCGCVVRPPWRAFLRAFVGWVSCRRELSTFGVVWTESSPMPRLIVNGAVKQSCCPESFRSTILTWISDEANSLVVGLDRRLGSSR
jgi:hypothetical protein